MSPQKKIAHALLLGGIVSQIFLQRNQLRLPLRLGVNAQQILDQLQPRIASFLFLIARPDGVDRIVVITQGLSRLPSLRPDPGEFQVHLAIFGLLVPQVHQIGIRLTRPLQPDQSLGQVQLVVVVVGGIQQRRAKFGNRTLKVPRLQVDHPAAEPAVAKGGPLGMINTR